MMQTIILKNCADGTFSPCRCSWPCFVCLFFGLLFGLLFFLFAFLV